MGSEQKRAFLAVVLSGIVLFTWQAFFAPKPSKETRIAETIKDKSDAKDSDKLKIADSKAVSVSNVVSGTNESNLANVENFKLKGANADVYFNSALSFNDFGSDSAVFGFQDIVGGKDSLQILLDSGSGFRNVQLNFEKSNDEKSAVGVNDELGLKISLDFSDNGKLNFSLFSQAPVKVRFQFKTEKKELESNQKRQFAYFSNDVEFSAVGDEFSYDGPLKWAGIDFHYHLFALVLGKKSSAKITAGESALMTVDTNEMSNELKGYFVFAKKNYDTLVSMGDNLDLSVDFGIFGILAVPILRGLQFFYKYVPNYGIAIILLTLIIRLITFPLQYKSFKSMKKMQKIQPELNKIKEKFKDDPQRMQRETMELFKKAGANPLGGCLPMVLQMPIFFAFYKVLYSAVELVEAPFMGWIVDLSIKDPYFVLPVLMAGIMFAQQKLTPTTAADPTQQKVMMFMPLIFGFIMKDLPSGLVLYICVSTLFGIGQQLLVYKTTD